PHKLSQNKTQLPGERTTKYKHINYERYNGGMERLQVPPLTEKQLSELEELYQKTKIPRELFESIKVLIEASENFFTRFNQPRIRSYL
ncbi:MAG: hypothetical protein ACM3PY_02515, partial [Omnitrophica WOR_2 bacterium]